MSLISKASREELEVLALHREAALTGVRRRGEEDNVAVGEIAASGERLDDAALAGKRRVRGRVREGEGDGVADFEGDWSFRARGCGIVGRGGRRLASRCGGRRAPVSMRPVTRASDANHTAVVGTALGSFVRIVTTSGMVLGRKVVASRGSARPEDLS